MIYVDNHIEFKISDAGTLLSVTNFSNDPDIDVFVPKVLPCGNEINLIGRGFLSGRFTIPEGCFSGTPLKRITGIDAVELIEREAFSFCFIEEFTWPSACSEIPQACFAHSFLRSLTNLNNVSSISEHAFASCRDLEGLDLSELTCCEIKAEAFRQVGPDKVILPYYAAYSDYDSLFAEKMGRVGLPEY